MSAGISIRATSGSGRGRLTSNLKACAQSAAPTKATGTKHAVRGPWRWCRVMAMNSASSAGVCQLRMRADTASSHCGGRHALSGQVNLEPARKTKAVATLSKAAMASREVGVLSTALTRWRQSGGLWEGRFMASYFWPVSGGLRVRAWCDEKNLR